MKKIRIQSFRKLYILEFLKIREIKKLQISVAEVKFQAGEFGIEALLKKVREKL